MTKIAENPCHLDVPKVKGSIRSIEDRIFITLLTEKGASKSELAKIINVNYKTISDNIKKMADKGYIIKRQFDNVEDLYFLTMSGVYELEYRFNLEYFKSLHNHLDSFGFDEYQIAHFLRNRFYKFYTKGEWDETTLVNQFVEWAESNNIDYEVKLEKNNSKKLKKTIE